jgi:hypothetical protein
MAGPGITVQFPDRFDNLCPDGIEMDVPDQSKKVIFLIAED